MAEPAPSSNPAAVPTTHKAFSEHINELRIRVMWVALVFMVTSAVAYHFRDFLVQLVMAPLGDQTLVYLTPAGGFSFIFQIAMYAAAVVTAPLVIYHLYKFVVPALPKHAHKHSLLVILAATTLMVAGVAFGYFVAIPAALSFLTNFAGDYVEATLTADSYLGFVLAYVAGLGVLFQLPLLLVFWNWMNPMGPGQLLSSERFVVVFAFIAAAIMTPTPDVMNQAMIAVPIIVIYQLGVVTVLVTNRSRARRALKVQSYKQSSVQPVSEDMAMASFDSLFESAHAAPIADLPVQRVARRPRHEGKNIDGFMVKNRTPVPARPVFSHAAAGHTAPRGIVRPAARMMSLDGISTFAK